MEHRVTELEGKYYLEPVFVSVIDRPPTVEVAEFVVTRLTKRGEGTREDPFRTIFEIWTPDGRKVGEIDPLTSET